MSKRQNVYLGTLSAGALFAALVLSPLEVMAAKSKKSGPMADTWYMKTVAVVSDGGEVFFDDRSGVFGRIPGGQNGKDTHDIPVFESVSGSNAAVVFVKTTDEWGEDGGQYLSDYRAPGSDKQSWTFTVTTNRADANVTLYWDTFFVIEEVGEGNYVTTPDNLNPVLAELKLLDLKTGDAKPASNKKGKMKTYSFNMGGKTERQFRWVQGKVKRSDWEMETNAQLGGGQLRADARVQPAAVNAPSAMNPRFGLPPMPGQAVDTTEPNERVRTEK